MKKSRKKMLLSSIAMLLVALVALGSATFAWYVTNATVTADDTDWSASSADGLVIRHGTSGDWLSKLTDLEDGTGLTPASITYGAIGDTLFGATGEGQSFDVGTLKDGTLGKAEMPATSPGNNKYFVRDTFYVASSNSQTKTAYFYVNGETTDKTYLNIAVYVNGSLEKVFTSDPTTTWEETSKIGGNANTPTVASGAQSLVKLQNNYLVGSFDATSKDSSNGAKIDIVAFVDGFNPKCTSALANTTAVKVNYSFTTNAPTPEP